MIITDHNRGRIVSEFSGDLKNLVIGYLEKYPDEVLHIPQICAALAAARIDFTKEEDFKFHAVSEGQGDVIQNAVEHNLKGLKEKAAMVRPLLLTLPLRSISHISYRLKQLKVLTIGPRTESEIFNLIACGFDPANITAIDLISYSPLVETGDMHALPYPDESFDVVIMGWVLAYSDNPVKAAREARRVAKPGAAIAVGCEYSPLSNEEQTDGGSLVGHGGRYDSADDILKLFEEDVETVWFRHDIDPSLRDKTDSVMTIFKRKGLAVPPGD